MIRRLGCALLVAGLLLVPRLAHADAPPLTPTPVAASPTPVAASPTPVATALPVYTYPPGIPAIAPEPRLHAQALANTATYSTTATYTVADVRAFLAAHRLFLTSDGSAPVIDIVEFIPAAQASTLLRGESIGRPDTTLVCYVQVHGPLAVSHHWPAGYHYTPKRPVGTPRRVGELVFDAQTGNLLLRGFIY